MIIETYSMFQLDLNMHHIYMPYNVKAQDCWKSGIYTQ